MKRFFGLLLALVLCCGVALAEEGQIVPKYDGAMLVAVGKTETVKYSLTTEALKKSSFSFQSSDESIATVNYKGGVKGIAVGECTLTITSKKYPGVSVELPVQVVQPVKKVALSVTEASMIADETLQLDYTCEPENATRREVVFSSSKESVATVDENGLITAQGRGTATITAKSVDGYARSSVQVTVKQLPEEITFKQESYTIGVDKTLKFQTTVLPRTANDKSLTWETSDASIATISKDGTLRSKAAGTVVITATSKADPSVVGTVTVHCVKPIQSISLGAQSYALHIGDTVQLTPAFTPEDATVTAVSWTSSNPRVCTVDENGLITALSGGESVVTVSSDENAKRKATVNVRVDVAVQSVTMDQKGFRLPVGTHAFATAKVRPTDATNKAMTWVSSNPEVAVVTNTSNRPRIEGLKWGRATLTGTTVDGGFTTSFVVNVGALHEAVAVQSAAKAGVTVQNLSDMHITSVTLCVQGTTKAGETVEQEFTFAVDLAPEAVSEGLTLPLDSMTKPSVAVVAWETDTGYYTNDETLKNSYRIANGLLEWRSVR